MEALLDQASVARAHVVEAVVGASVPPGDGGRPVSGARLGVVGVVHHHVVCTLAGDPGTRGLGPAESAGGVLVVALLVLVLGPGPLGGERALIPWRINDFTALEAVPDGHLDVPGQEKAPPVWTQPALAVLNPDPGRGAYGQDGRLHGAGRDVYHQVLEAQAVLEQGLDVLANVVQVPVPNQGGAWLIDMPGLAHEFRQAPPAEFGLDAFSPR